jgi:hypothetical protein
MPQFSRFFVAYTSIAFLTIFGVLALTFISVEPEVYQLWAQEYGPVETLAASLFGVTALGAFIIAIKYKKQPWWLLTYFMAFATMRELDWHKAFTSDSILKSNFYKNADIPAVEKIGGALFILTLVIAAILLLRHTKQWIQHLFKFNETALAIFMALGFIGVAKTLDGIARKFPFMADFAIENRAVFQFIEEVFECAGGVFFLYIVLAAGMEWRKNKNA